MKRLLALIPALMFLTAAAEVPKIPFSEVKDSTWTARQVSSTLVGITWNFPVVNNDPNTLVSINIAKLPQIEGKNPWTLVYLQTESKDTMVILSLQVDNQPIEDCRGGHVHTKCTLEEIDGSVPVLMLSLLLLPEDIEKMSKGNELEIEMANDTEKKIVKIPLKGFAEQVAVLKDSMTYPSTTPPPHQLAPGQQDTAKEPKKKCPTCVEL